MSRIVSLTIVVMVLSNGPARAVKFDWATVGNPGNASDATGFGSVDYIYSISKHEVTNAQYTEFLNAVAAADPHGLYNYVGMGSQPQGGIIRSGSSGSVSYSVKPDAKVEVEGDSVGGVDTYVYTYANKPVVGVSYVNAMRFVNWLENGQPTGAQGPDTTEDGVYSISDGVSEVRNPKVTYFIPSENEWYKAAYYDPTGNGGAGVYYDYSTSTDLLPDNNLPSLDTGNSANYTGFFSRTTDNFNYPLTDVGAYVLSGSPYGTYDQGGNVKEWNEAVVDPFRRSFRGGSWLTSEFALSANHRFGGLASYGGGLDNSFRVASIPIPEPRGMLTVALAAMGLVSGIRNCRDYRNPIYYSSSI
jgi:formylglycine-generating enzyme required for sulfatase activity